MDGTNIDPAIAQSVDDIVNRFGAPGLDQLEEAVAAAREEARRAIIAPVERAPLTPDGADG